LAEVEVDEVLRLVCYVRAEIAADNAVPGWDVLLVELLLNVSSNILLNVVLLERLSGDIDGILLHLLRHIGILDNGLAFAHDDDFDLLEVVT